MNKKRIATSVKLDGHTKTTTRASKYGSSYRKESSIRHETISHDPDYFFDNMEQLLNQRKKNPISFSIEQLSLYAKEILDWLISKHKKPPIYAGKCNLDLLSKYIDKEVSIKGALEASRCLNTISNLNRHIKLEEYEECLAFAFNLVHEYSLFQYSILEGTISSGNVDSVSNRRMSYDNYQKCFTYFNTLDSKKDGTRKLNIREKWDETVIFAQEELKVTISEQSLRKEYKNQGKPK
mgnify:CR=1 FL=1